MILREILDISLAGRAPKQDPTLFALALCARYQVGYSLSFSVDCHFLLTIPRFEDFCFFGKPVLKRQGLMILREILDISLAGRAPKQDPTLFALALCARYQVRDTSKEKSTPKSGGDQSDKAKQRKPDQPKYRELKKPLDKTYQKSLQQLALFAVCRIPTHLFMFIKYCKMISGETGLKVESKGWGRALRATVCRW
ncbi:unnamed protein product [Gongylonema pulchrum]|uniref:TROVE domain-containing protein n=1 Tax=Gongylonema pulchrum TaxID=637853 RepID=A0A183DTM4_9BILA|nr:unnamed protein product [Gongylonema pulchrum]